MNTTTNPVELTDADFAETKPQPQTELTVYGLKAAARLREQARRDAVARAEAAREDDRKIRRYTLDSMLHSNDPFAALVNAGPASFSDEGTGHDLDIIVSFAIPGHAEIQARFVWRDDHWEHQGFMKKQAGSNYTYYVADDEQMWRVREWTGTGYEPESETYYAKYRSVDFRDLGDALLHAERAYRDPADIQGEVDDHNRMAAFNSPITPSETPAPEPTPEEILVAALKQFVRATANEPYGYAD